MATMASKIKDTFGKYDRDGDGCITATELQAVLHALGSFQEFMDWLMEGAGTTKKANSGDVRAKAALKPGTGDGMETCFYNFCGSGHTDMDGKSFLKMVKDCRLVDKKLTVQDIDLIFAKVVPKGQRRINYTQFEAAVKLVAEKRCDDLDEIRETILDSERPVVRGTKTEPPKLSSENATMGRVRSENPQRPRDEEPGQRFGRVATEGACPRRPARPRASVVAPCQNAQTSPSGREIDWKAAFSLYCSNGKDLDGRSFVKLCKDANMLDAQFSMNDADILFTKNLASGQRRMGFMEFNEVLYKLAELKNCDYGSLLEAIARTGGPVLVGTQACGTRRSVTIGPTTAAAGGSETCQVRSTSRCSVTQNRGTSRSATPVRACTTDRGGK
eukprot:TRINITY_DN6349_c0_g1_i2.p1 TRINITY_DN6349_c0_g1~~TRINITY_DN6349_c0_g1_i2.p1  ORF type:complete len:412 (-),score=69.62 TRINITY_DN6349_c0_g1_i2:32-1192(-)